jgi:iron complex transport system substrate-binding protein
MRSVSKDIQIPSITAAIMAFLILALLCHAEGNAQGTRSVTDRIGRTVKVPLEPKRIACFFGPSYEKVFRS